MPALVTGIEIVLTQAEANGERRADTQRRADKGPRADKERRYVYRSRKGQLVYCGPRS